MSSDCSMRDVVVSVLDQLLVEPDEIVVTKDNYVGDSVVLRKWEPILENMDESETEALRVLFLGQDVHVPDVHVQFEWLT
jgi:hypothetical protein